jgi:molecular chaperone GrpE
MFAKNQIIKCSRALLFKNKLFVTPSQKFSKFNFLRNKEEKKEEVEKENVEEVEEKKEKKVKTMEEALEKITRLEESLVKNKDVKEKYLQSLAEMENTRRIAREDVDKAKKYALNNFASSLLEVADNLSLAISTTPTDKISPEDKVLKNLLQGIIMTEKILQKVFSHYQIKPIEDPTNKEFNPEFHEAMMKIEKPEMKSDTVFQVLKRGYFLNDRILRPAQVVVVENNETKEESEESKESNEEEKKDN